MLGLGSNLGPSEAILRQAVDELSLNLGPLETADLFRTTPQSSIEQPDYLNTVVRGRTLLPPDVVLAITKSLEQRAGRRMGPRTGPRLLDLDLLLWGDLLSDRPELTLPHPGLTQRRFVLEPLAQLAPDLVIPPDGPRVADLLERIGQEGEVVRIGWEAPP